MHALQPVRSRILMKCGGRMVIIGRLREEPVSNSLLPENDLPIVLVKVSHRRTR